MTAGPATHGTPSGTPAGHHEEPHLPHSSVWPFWLANSIALVGLGFVFIEDTSIPMALGGVTLHVPWLLLLGVAAVVYTLFFGWIREDVRWWWSNTGTGAGMAKAGTLLFIGSEVFIFGALFSTYFTFQRLADHWPDTEHSLPIVKTFIFSLFLFASSATIHFSEKHLKSGNRKGFQAWWGATIVLGAIFLVGQVLEYVSLVKEGATLTSSQFMTNFYMLTGTHGLHVFGGLILLIVMFIRSRKGQFDEHRHDGPQVAAIYWHFVDLVWIFVFTVLYIVPHFFLGGAGGH